MDYYSISHGKESIDTETSQLVAMALLLGRLIARDLKNLLFVIIVTGVLAQTVSNSQYQYCKSSFLSVRN